MRGAAGSVAAAVGVFAADWPSSSAVGVADARSSVLKVLEEAEWVC